MKYTDITILLDRSGSMGSIQDDIIGGVNSFIAKQVGGSIESRITLVLFDTQNPNEVVYAERPAKDCPMLTAETFQPRGGTPLYDAIGWAMRDTGHRIGGKSEEDKPDGVVFVIVTDGQENSSMEFNAATIASQVKHQTEKYNWQFVYMGANHDAYAQASKAGINANSMKYGISGQSIRSAFEATGSNVRTYAQHMNKAANTGVLAYTDEQKKAADSGA